MRTVPNLFYLSSMRWCILHIGLGIFCCCSWSVTIFSSGRKAFSDFTFTFGFNICIVWFYKSNKALKASGVWWISHGWRVSMMLYLEIVFCPGLTKTLPDLWIQRRCGLVLSHGSMIICVSWGAKQEVFCRSILNQV